MLNLFELPPGVEALDEYTFNALIAHVKNPMADHFLQELFWLKAQSRPRIGTLLRDRVDKDYGFVVFELVGERYAFLDTQHSLLTAQQALDALVDALTAS